MDPTIAVAIVSACAVIIAGIVKFVPSRPALPAPTNGNRSVTQSECAARMETASVEIKVVGRDVVALKEETRTGFDRLHDAVKEIKTEQNPNRKAEA